MGRSGGRSSVVERLPSKQNVTGSNPAARSTVYRIRTRNLLRLTTRLGGAVNNTENNAPKAKH